PQPDANGARGVSLHISSALRRGSRPPRRSEHDEQYEILVDVVKLVWLRLWNEQHVSRRNLGIPARGAKPAMPGHHVVDLILGVRCLAVLGARCQAVNARADVRRPNELL